jgi:hypothetical protein
MKYLQLFEEVSNLSKVRKFPTLKDRDTFHNLKSKDRKRLGDTTDFYFVYDLSKKDLGKYLNTWFSGNVKHFDEGGVICDEMWTVKRVDARTSQNLYHRNVNPVSINIYFDYKNKDKSGANCNMKATIHSIDDSSYGAWFLNKSVDELKEIRVKLMKYVNSKSVMNGDEFMETCKELGATDFDYN